MHQRFSQCAIKSITSSSILDWLGKRHTHTHTRLDYRQQYHWLQHCLTYTFRNRMRNKKCNHKECLKVGGVSLIFQVSMYVCLFYHTVWVKITKRKEAPWLWNHSFKATIILNTQEVPLVVACVWYQLHRNNNPVSAIKKTGHCVDAWKCKEQYSKADPVCQQEGSNLCCVIVREQCPFGPVCPVEINRRTLLNQSTKSLNIKYFFWLAAVGKL